MFSIVICSYNKSRSLKAVLTNLNSLVRNNGDYKFEVIVVVDGSTDDTIEVIKATPIHYPFRYFYIENSGLSEARNFGIDQCEGDYVICCDDDVLLHPDYLENLSASVKLHPLNVHIGNLINIGKQYSPAIIDDLVNERSLDFSTFYDLRFYHTFFEAAKKLYAFKDQYQDFNPAIWWAVVTGGNLCIPRHYFALYGKFDGNIKGWGPEDADLCYRFFKNGVRASYNEDCYLYHLDHDRNATSLLESMTRNAVYFIKKYSKPRELYGYLNFTNAKTSLLDFNNECCDIFGMEKVEIPPFSMSMKDYSGREQFLKSN